MPETDGPDTSPDVKGTREERWVGSPDGPDVKQVLGNRGMNVTSTPLTGNKAHRGHNTASTITLRISSGGSKWLTSRPEQLDCHRTCIPVFTDNLLLSSLRSGGLPHIEDPKFLFPISSVLLHTGGGGRVGSESLVNPGDVSTIRTTGTHGRVGHNLLGHLLERQSTEGKRLE